MTFYPETAPRRAAMILSDVVILIWVAVWIEVASAVQDAVDRLAAPGTDIENAGRGLARSLGDAAGSSRGIPLVGGRLADPLDAARAASDRLARAGVAEQTAAHRLALVLAVAIAFLALVPVLTSWLPQRLRWIAAATAAARMRSTSGGPALTVLAVRAAARRPLTRLAAARLGGEPFAVADRDALEALAALELRSLGLRGAPG